MKGNQQERDKTIVEDSNGAGSSPAASSAPAAPDPEVSAVARRRTFTAKYKLQVLREVDACSEPGEISALLRREGLYSSHLSNWRRSRASGELKALSPRKRGRKAKAKSREAFKDLERENERLRRRLDRAEKLLEIQKKISELLGLPLTSEDDETR